MILTRVVVPTLVTRTEAVLHPYANVILATKEGWRWPCLRNVADNKIRSREIHRSAERVKTMVTSVPITDWWFKYTVETLVLQHKNHKYSTLYACLYCCFNLNQQHYTDNLSVTIYWNSSSYSLFSQEKFRNSLKIVQNTCLNFYAFKCFGFVRNMGQKFPTV